MHEYASRLVGLYFCNAMPHAISIGFENTARSIENFDGNDDPTKEDK